MKTNKKPLSIVERAKKSFVGKCICRLVGEEKGQAMMEYVIIAVMIAAAVALGAYFFGSTILDYFGIGQRSIAGEHTEAGDDVVASRTEVQNRNTAAKNNANKFSTTPTQTPNGNAGGN